MVLGSGRLWFFFRSQAEATRALSLNGQRFLGSEVILKCISRSQMKQLGVDPAMGQEPRQERLLGRSNEASYNSVDKFPDLRMSNDSNISMNNVQVQGGRNYEPFAGGSCAPQDRGNGFRGDFGPSMQPIDGPTCVKLVNLPFQIRNEEIYDFCYGYSIIPGSVSLQYDQSGRPTGTATVVFESRPEAVTAVEELTGRTNRSKKNKASVCLIVILLVRTLTCPVCCLDTGPMLILT